MMVFITRYWKNPNRPSLQGFALGAILLLATSVPAGNVQLKRAELLTVDNFYAVNAQFDVQLPPALNERLHQGLPLFFVAEFDITGPRWYSWYRAVADGFLSTGERRFRLSYHPILRQYRVTSGNASRSFATLQEAMASFSTAHHWKILPADGLNRNLKLQGRVRLRLDTDQLPEPVQLDTLGNSDWDLDSDWLEVASN